MWPRANDFADIESRPDFLVCLFVCQAMQVPDVQWGSMVLGLAFLS